MHASVVICTWNRAELLSRTLESMVRLEVPSHIRWELIVVNNRCTDATEAVLRRFAALLPLRALYEPRQGKSHALNRALLAVRGELIIFTDDDVLVMPDWITAHLGAARVQSEAVFFGGPVEPVFDSPPPAWILECWDTIKPAFAAVDLGDEPRTLTSYDDIPFGANFAVRSEVQRRFLYDTRLGRVGGNAIRGEETAVVWALLHAGLHGFWIPSTRVRHIIPPERMELDYVRQWFYGIGRTLAIMGVEGGHRRRRLRTLFRALRRETRYRLNRVLQPPQVWGNDMVQASREWGVLAHLQANRRQRRIPSDKPSTATESAATESAARRAA